LYPEQGFNIYIIIIIIINQWWLANIFGLFLQFRAKVINTCFVLISVLLTSVTWS